MEYGFGRLPNFYLGIEEEFQIFDKDSYKPVYAKDIIEELKKEHNEKYYKEELLINSIEINTEPSNDIGTISENLKQIRESIAEKSEENNVYCIAIGMYPYVTKDDLEINVPYANRRAQAFLDPRIADGKDYAFNACHIHTSIDKYENAMKFLDCASVLSPILLALSASSPAFEGKPTGYLSYRRKIWERIGNIQKQIKTERCEHDIEKYEINCNTPPHNMDREDWDFLFSANMMLGSWLTRVDHPSDKGTVQFRVFDAVGYRKTSLALASLCQGIEYCFLNGKLDYEKCLNFSNGTNIEISYTKALQNDGIKQLASNLITYVVENSEITIKEDLYPLKRIIESGNISEKILNLLHDKKRLTEKFSLNGGMK